MSGGPVAGGPAPGEGERLRRLLGGPDLAWLLQRMRARLEQGRPLTGTVALRSASTAQRLAVARLFGAPLRPATTATVHLEELDGVLRRSGAWTGDLEGAVVALTGPYEVRAETLAARRAEWEDAWAPVAAAVEDHPAAELRAALQEWWRREVETGAVRRAASSPQAARTLAEQAARVLRLLPADGVAIGALAHAATGSAHALDRGPLASLVLRAARAVASAGGATAADEFRDESRDDRAVWAAVGVVRDEVSSTVLGLALPAASEGATGVALAAWAERVQPVVITLRQLRLDPPTWSAPSPGAAGRPGASGSVVRVVENPVVLTAVADRALAEGVCPPPVLCTSGWPSAAATSVLRALRTAGWELHHHGDLDPDGVAITDRLVREVGAAPWRMGADDYRAAVSAGLGRPAVVGRVSASWDAALGPAMHERQQVVEEEAVLDALVAEALHRG